MSNTVDKSKEGREHFYTLVREFNDCMMVTKDKDTGLLRSRPMRILKADEDGIWFLCSIDSLKVLEIEKDPNLNASMQKEGSKYLSISGKGSIVRDVEMIKSLWSEHMRMYFPNGPESADIALIKMTPETGEYWDFSGIMKKLQYAFQAGKAILTHSKISDEQKITENVKVDLHTQRKGEQVM